MLVTASACHRAEVPFDLPAGRDEERLLHAMGFETANVHLGTRGAARAIGRELRDREPRWLRQIADTLTAEILRDWKCWRGRAPD